MSKPKPQAFAVIHISEKGEHVPVKRGISARENSLGHFIFDPSDPADGPDRAEWFATAGRRSYLRPIVL